jgi:hypothetical protein
MLFLRGHQRPQTRTAKPGANVKSANGHENWRKFFDIWKFSAFGLFRAAGVIGAALFVLLFLAA